MPTDHSTPFTMQTFQLLRVIKDLHFSPGHAEELNQQAESKGIG